MANFASPEIRNRRRKKAAYPTSFFACVERGIKNIRAESVIRISSAMNVSTDYLLLGKSSAIDRGNLMEMMEPLSELQLKCLEEIIKNYVAACTANKNPDKQPK